MSGSLAGLPVVDVRVVLENEGTLWGELNDREQQEALVRVWDTHALDGEGVIDLAGLGWEAEGAPLTTFKWIRVTRVGKRGTRIMATFYVLEKAGELYDVYLGVPRKKARPNPFVDGTRPLRLNEGRKWGDKEGKQREALFGDPEGWEKDYRREVNRDPLAMSKQLANRGESHRNDEVVAVRDPYSRAWQVRFNTGKNSFMISGMKLGPYLYRARLTGEHELPYAVLQRAIHGGHKHR
ncbi:hypothetical protein [Corynebacterium lubricantis]|uniref:hypothetical protein n=1 Tax=Corynebacterium lubricantis TaxID=541095 RepID=UPI0003745C10|nr:hypothetical protein [Corynebacterium lubricantis]